MRLTLLFMLFCAGTMSAQATDSQAKRILEQPAYKGYRVERPQSGPGQASWDGDSGRGSTGREVQDRQDGRLRRTGEGEARRARRYDGGGSEGGGGGGGPGPDLSWIGAVFEVLVWIVVIAAVLVGLFFLVKAILGIKRDRRKVAKRKVEKKKAATAVAGEPAPDAAPEPEAAPFADALALAQREYDQAVAQQQWGRAVLLGYRIFWLRAGWPGCVEETDVRTWRDALRMVRATELRQRVRGLLRMVESVRYGEHTPGREEFVAWQGELDDVNPREALR